MNMTNEENWVEIETEIRKNVKKNDDEKTEE